MTSIGSPSPFFLAGKKAYEVERSFRFNDDDSTYLARTPSSASNRKTWSLSLWFKRGNLGMAQNIFCTTGSDNSTFFDARIQTDNTITLGLYTSYLLQTNQVFRDPSAWYHMVVVLDSTQATASNRLKWYINGNQITSFSTDNISSLITQNGDFGVNSTAQMTFGKHNLDNNKYFDGYMAEINHIDGQAYDPSYFGETNATTGQWNPKKYVGSYGTNGFYLDFSDNSSITNMCLDKSGNGNNFSPDGSNTEDSMLDSPTNNFCTLNLLDDDYNGPSTFSQGNLFASRGGSDHGSMRGTMGMSSGKWYFEYCLPTATNGSASFWAGVCNSTADMTVSRTNGMWNYGGSNGEFIVRGTGNTGIHNYGSAIAAGTVVGVAVDMDNKKIWIGKNNTWFGSSNADTDGNPSTGANPTSTFTDSQIPDGNLYPQMGLYNYASKANFGQDSTFSGTKTRQGNSDANGKGDFFYAPPTGFKALCSANFPDPTIKLPNKHFDTFIYSGDNNATRTFSNVLQFQPDFFWTKARNVGYAPIVIDSVRGTGQLKSLATQNDSVEGNELDNATYGYINSFDANGFSVTKGSASSSFTNESGKNYVTWNINAGNTDGKTYIVKVLNFSGNNRYIFDDFQTEAVTLDLAEGGTYIFDQSDSSNVGHPLRFSTTSNGTHGGGTEYTTGVTTAGTPGSSGAYTQIVVAASAPTLYYYCTQHSGMGGQVNTNSTLGSSNFEGNTQAIVKANPTAGFSIISWNARGTSSGTYDTLGHGLGARPNVLILKSRNNTGNWNVYNSNFDSAHNKILQFSNTIAETTSSNYWGADNTTPSSTLIHLNQGNYSNNASPPKFIMYAFTEISGFSKFGTYTGNASSSYGKFVYLGFRPAFIILKGTSDSTAFWTIIDNKRNEFNAVNKWLYSNDAQSEYNASSYPIDFLANGFIVKTNASYTNTSGGTYIYLAFAESPFKYARAR
jgi:hypothetical protein